MKKSRFKPLVVLALLFAMLLQLPSPSFALNDGKMAHNIYSDPIVSGTSQTYDTFTIDFRASETPYYTYWALCNWSMSTAGSKAVYPKISGTMGAYAGLQNTARLNGRKAIMSFWEVDIGEGKENGKALRATRMYPEGADHGFGGEGEGNNWITPYEWKDNQWYRMVLHCWKDAETGTTFVGQWFQDLETEKWTLISVFDTKLVDSYFQGGMSQFMENYGSSNADPERDCNFKNMYVLDHRDGKWKSLYRTKMSFDHYNRWKNKRGEHSFGVDDNQEYFWGKSNGILPDGWTDTAAYDDSCQNNVTLSIKQPDTPTFSDATVDGATLTKTDAGWTVKWNVPDTAAPQLSYKVDLYNKKGELLESKAATRPEIRSVDLAATNTEMLRCEITVTDLFGKEIKTSVETTAYKTQPGDVNEDGEFTIEDVTAMLVQLSTGVTTEIADITEDGEVTSKDVSRLLQKIAQG